jgi:preprotein translocase subunit SecB
VIEDNSELRTFPIALADVFCVRCVSERRPRDINMTERDPERIEVKVNLMRGDLSEDQRVFGCRLQVVADYPVLKNELLACDVTVQGVFSSEAAVEPDAFTAFAEYTPLVLLWPFARAYMAELGRMHGVSLPLLPTVDALNPSGGAGTTEAIAPEAPA